jgi:hypothetical protein
MLMILDDFRGINLSLLVTFPLLMRFTINLSEIRAAIMLDKSPKLHGEPLYLNAHETMICFSDFQIQEIVEEAHISQIHRHFSGAYNVSVQRDSTDQDICNILDFQFKHLAGDSELVTSETLVTLRCVLGISVESLQAILDRRGVHDDNRIYYDDEDRGLYSLDCIFSLEGNFLSVHEPEYFRTRRIRVQRNNSNRPWEVVDDINDPIINFSFEDWVGGNKLINDNDEYVGTYWDTRNERFPFDEFDISSNRRCVMSKERMWSLGTTMNLPLDGNVVVGVGNVIHCNPPIVQVFMIRLSTFIDFVGYKCRSDGIPSTSQYIFRPSRWDHKGDNKDDTCAVGEVVLPVYDDEKDESPMVENISPLSGNRKVWEIPFQVYNDYWFEYTESTHSFLLKDGTVLFSLFLLSVNLLTFASVFSDDQCDEIPSSDYMNTSFFGITKGYFVCFLSFVLLRFYPLYVV